MSHFNGCFYQQDLEELKKLDMFKHKTLNEMFNVFHEKLLEIIDKNAPFKTLTKRKEKLKKKKEKKPWITKSISPSLPTSCLTSRIHMGK